MNEHFHLLGRRKSTEEYAGPVSIDLETGAIRPFKPTRDETFVKSLSFEISGPILTPKEEAMVPHFARLACEYLVANPLSIEDESV